MNSQNEGHCFKACASQEGEIEDLVLIFKAFVGVKGHF